jgi:hypothetical protein
MHGFSNFRLRCDIAGRGFPKFGLTLREIWGKVLESSTKGLQAPEKEEIKMMEQSKFPKGWDEGRVKRVLDHYEAQSIEEAVAEDEAAYPGLFMSCWLLVNNGIYQLI